MRRVLVFCGYYTPAYKGGGPRKTIAGVVDALGDEFDFWIVTNDRDLGDASPLPGVTSDAWAIVGKAHVCYVSPKNMRPGAMRRLIRSMDYHLLYLNSFFSPAFTVLSLVLRRLDLIDRKPAIVAPRGEFSPSALGLKSGKKRAFVVLARLLGLYSDVYWQVSSEQERACLIDDFLGHRTSSAMHRVMVAPDLAPDRELIRALPHPAKRRGALRIVFLARISPMKNLQYALEVAAGLPGRITFDIYGPVASDASEQAYWQYCQGQMRDLPPNIVVTYQGAVEPDLVPQTLAGYDLFFLPTLGENFGHAILEALSSGCPVLISDRTPWCDLAKFHAGWDLPLEQPEVFRQVLQSLVDMDETEFSIWREGARAFAQRYLSDDTNVERQRQVFLTALQGA
ncbi:MAG: glycosyltransferase [Anaerolineae bacterium]